MPQVIDRIFGDSSLENQKCSYCDRPSLDGENVGVVWICDECIQRYFKTCKFCGQKSHEDMTIYQGKKICKNCISSLNLFVCYRCGNVTETRFRSKKDIRFCILCNTVKEQKEIQSAGYKPQGMVFLSTKQGENEFLGIELEFQWSSSENRQKVLEFLSKFEDFYLKEDGSVPSGCEIVTFPANKEYHIQRFETLLFELNNLQCVSHDSGDCGIHIHISRLAFGANTRTQSQNIAKLLYLVEHFQRELKIFSRREKKCFDSSGASWNPSHPYKYCEFYNLDYTDGKITRQYQKAVYKNKVRIHHTRFGDEYIRSGRYKVLNFQNKDTVEFRLLRGSLNYRTFVSSLEFLCLLVKIAKTTTEKDLLKLTWGDIVKNAVDIPSLFEQFKKLNLISI